MFKIISDGGCDFSEKEAKEHGVTIIPFYISLDGENYLKEGVDIKKDDYFKQLLANKKLFPKTSQPSPADYIDEMIPHLKEGLDIIILTVSSHLSGSNQSAVNAAKLMEEEYPQRQIIALDSLSGCIGQGVILRELIRMRNDGLDTLKAKEVTEKIIKNANIYFTLDTLEYLKKGGRIGPTSALVGGLLNLRPILYVEEGKVASLEKVRGKKNAYKLMKEALIEALREEKNNINLSIGHILSEEDATEFKDAIEEALEIKMENPLTEVGATIGTHIGPGALAFAYCKKYENFL
ncbi:MAG: DegV family protein [Defluviitaleaceae bacterium]|nr:DegV family protein [Defluviitaleaceae bacterium]